MVNNSSRVAKSLLEEECRLRRQAAASTERAMSRLLTALERKAENAVEDKCKRLLAEKKMTSDLLERQTERTIAAEQRIHGLEEKLSEVSRLLATTLEQARAQGSELKLLRKKEQDAVTEINRRAVQQAQLRETIQELERAVAQNSQAFEFQRKLIETQDELRGVLASKEQEQFEFMQVKGDLEAQNVRLQGELSAVKAQLERAKASQATNATPSQVGVLQDKIDRQLVEIIRLKTEITKREKDVLQHKRQLETQTKLVSELQTQLYQTRTLLSDEKVASSDAALGQSKEEGVDALIGTLQKELELTREELVKMRQAFHEEQRRSREKETSLQKEIVSLNEELLTKEQVQLEKSELEADLSSAHARVQDLERLLQSNSPQLKTQQSKQTELEEQSLLEESKELFKLCQEVSAETAVVKSRLVSLEEEGKPATQQEAEMDFRELLVELQGLKNDCARHQQDASLIKRNLEQLQLTQKKNMEFAAELEAECAHLHECLQEEEDVKQDALMLRQEAARISATATALLRQMHARASSPTEVPSTVVLDDPALPLDEAGSVLFRQRQDSASRVFHTIEQEKSRRLSILSQGKPEQQEEDTNEEQQNGNEEKMQDENEQEEVQVEVEGQGPTQPKILMKGYLLKSPPQNKPYWSRWRRRWFVLSGNVLYYFKTPKSAMPKGFVPLTNARVDGPRDIVDEESFKFFLVTPSREYILCADDKSQMIDWVRYLDQVISTLHPNGSGSGRPSETQSSAGADVKSSGYYDLLGIPRNATMREIETAYETKASKYGPGASTEPDLVAFEELKKAHGILSTPSLRADYDVSLDVKDLFIASFTALVYPENGSGKGKPRPLPKKLYSDPGFTKIHWCDPDNLDPPSRHPFLGLDEIKKVVVGEEAKGGPLFRLPIERAVCSFTLVSRNGPILNVEVDRKIERDRIVHGIQMAIAALKSSPAGNIGASRHQAARSSQGPAPPPPPPPPPGSPPPPAPPSSFESDKKKTGTKKKKGTSTPPRSPLL